MKVILATDGSQYAEEAAWLLAHLPHLERLELTVLFVSNVPDLFGETATKLIEQMQAEDAEKSAAIFAHLREVFDGANAALELVVAHGQIGTTIVNEARARRSDLVVLGAIGHGMLDRLFGSTSDFVATHASCSVLVVRPTGLKSTKRPIDVCFAYDTSSSSAVFEQLSQFGWGENSKIEVTNVVSIPFIYSEIPYELDIEEIKTATLRELESAAIRLRKYSPHVKTHVLEANHVGDGLVQFAKEKGSDIIIMGNTGKGLLNTFFLGSTSKYVLRHAACSVWIARKRPE